MGQPTTKVTGTGTDPASDIYYNFALVYTDGEVSGSVNNLSGSNGSIDIIISSPNPLDDDQKVETSSSGNFGLGGLLEAIGYTAVIEDAGFASPCMNAAEEPDDDLESDLGDFGCGECQMPTLPPLGSPPRSRPTPMARTTTSAWAPWSSTTIVCPPPTDDRHRG